MINVINLIIIMLFVLVDVNCEGKLFHEGEKRNQEYIATLEIKINWTARLISQKVKTKKGNHTILMVLI